MNFKDTYVKESEALKPENKDKAPLSNDAFAIGDMIEKLINKIEHTRVSLIK